MTTTFHSEEFAVSPSNSLQGDSVLTYVLGRETTSAYILGRMTLAMVLQVVRGDGSLLEGDEDVSIPPAFPLCLFSNIKVWLNGERVSV
jgi:hypothetical protein